MYEEAGVTYIPAIERRHYMTTGTGFVESSDTGTMAMMARHAGMTFLISANWYSYIINQNFRITFGPKIAA